MTENACFTLLAKPATASLYTLACSSSYAVCCHSIRELCGSKRRSGCERGLSRTAVRHQAVLAYRPQRSLDILERPAGQGKDNRVQAMHGLRGSKDWQAWVQGRAMWLRCAWHHLPHHRNLLSCL